MEKRLFLGGVPSPHHSGPALGSSAHHGLCASVSCRHTCGCCQSFPFKGREALPERVVGGEGDMRPAERPHLSLWQTKDRGSAWSIAGGACLLLRMERAILCWPRGLGHILRRGRQCVGSEQLGPGIQNPKQVSSRHPQPRSPQAEESGFNFLVSAKRRRKRTRRRRRKERAEVPVQWAGICHSAHSPLTTKGSRAVSGP